MKKQDRLSRLLSQKSVQCCENCKHFKLKETKFSDQMDGICDLNRDEDDQCTFYFEYCNQYEKENQKDIENICPICKQKLEERVIVNSDGTEQIRRTCKNNCFNNLKEKYLKCPVCNNGYMKQRYAQYGKFYRICENCGFQLSEDVIINYILS